MRSAIEQLKEEYITEDELATFLNVDTKRIRDLRSHHVTGKQEFINHIKPTGRCRLYLYEDVLKFLENCEICSFGISNTNLD